MIIISHNDALREIAKKFRQHRILCQFTQAELSARSGVALSTLRQFEQKGHISLTHLLKIAVILNLLDSLIQGLSLPQATRLEDLVARKEMSRRSRVR